MLQRDYMGQGTEPTASTPQAKITRKQPLLTQKCLHNLFIFNFFCRGLGVPERQSETML